MTPERRAELEANVDLKLTADEMADGYVFCCEFDGLLIHKTDHEAQYCTCLKEQAG